MTHSGFFTATIVADLCSILSGFGILLLSKNIRKRNRLINRLQQILFWTILVFSLSDLAVSAADSNILLIPAWMKMAFPNFLILGLTFFSLIQLLTMQTLAGKIKTILKGGWLWCIPAMLLLILLIINLFSGFLFYVDPDSNNLVHTHLYHLVIVPLLIYLFMTMTLLWKVNPNAFLLLCMLSFFTLYAYWQNLPVSLIPLLFSLGTLLILVCSLFHGILFQFSSVLITLFIVSMLASLNLVSSTSFSSLFLTTRMNQEEHVSEFFDYLYEYPYLSTILDFIEKQAQQDDSLLTRDIDFDDPIIENYSAVNDKLAEIHGAEYADLRKITSADLSTLTEQELDALYLGLYHELKLSLEYIKDEFDVGDLYLIQKTGEKEGIIYFFASDSNTFPIGRPTDISQLVQGWRNFQIITSEAFTTWMWNRFSQSDPYAYTLDFTWDNIENPLVLSCSIPGSVMTEIISVSNTFQIFTILLMAFILIVILLLLYFTVLSPIRKMKEIGMVFQKNSDTNQLRDSLNAISSTNEIGSYAKLFALLITQIEQSTTEVTMLTGEQEKIRTELNLATTIQQGALPAGFPDRPEFSLYATMTPARDIGGDFYDFFEIDQTHLALVIADVSGKGVPAALFMMGARIMINDQVMFGGTPGQVLTAVNQECEKNYQKNLMFVTVWLGILDLKTGDLTCSNAGHEYPILRGSDGVFRLFKDKHGLVVGGVKGVRYKDYVIHMEPGDAVFVYTDGVPEADNRKHEFFGLDRLESALNSAPAEAGPEEILRTVRSHVDEFIDGAEPFDDLTMMCLVYHGKGSADLAES